MTLKLRRLRQFGRTGVPFDKDGYPDFSENAYLKVELEHFNAKRDIDNRIADRMAGIDLQFRQEHGLTWHHHQDGKTLLLVPRDIHHGTAHSGGIAKSGVSGLLLL